MATDFEQKEIEEEQRKFKSLFRKRKGKRKRRRADTDDVQIVFPLPREVLELHRFADKDPDRPRFASVRIEADEKPNTWCAIATDGHHMIVVCWLVLEALPSPFFLTARICKQALQSVTPSDEWEGTYHLSKHKVVICRAGNSYSDKFDSEQSFPPWRDYLGKMPPEGTDATNLISLNPTMLEVLGMYMRKCDLDGRETRWGIPDNSLGTTRIELLGSPMIEIVYVIMPCRM